jgi:carbon-monoxide dehydrogenase medium subunit
MLGHTVIDFDWVEPASLPEALQTLSNYGEDGKIIAGGTWVTLVLKQGLLYPSALIALRGVPGLAEVVVTPKNELLIGAMVTHRAIEKHPLLGRHFPMLAETFGVVANVRIRNQATVGGCLCDADYASDPPAMLTALDARVSLQSAANSREVLVEDFITGHYETTIAPDELLTQVTVPALPRNARGVYTKFRTRSHEDRPCVGVAVVLATDGDVLSHLRVAVGAVADRPQRFPDIEQMALGQPMSESRAQDIANAYADSIDPLDDLRGSAWYRQQMIRVLVRRTLLQAAKRETVE